MQLLYQFQIVISVGFFLTSTCFVLFEVTLSFSSISDLVAEFVYFNLAAILSVANLFNSWVVIYLSWL